MKKSKKIAISSLCLTPLLLLTACVPPPSYSITASSSDMQLGYVTGFDNEAMKEGSKVTLNAISKNENNEFICWVKDNQTIASSESNLELVYNAESAGHYTAVFEEDLSSMMYATLTDMTFAPNGYTSIEYTISTAISTASSDYYEFASSSYSIGETQTIQPTAVIYLGDAYEEYTFFIKIKFNLTNTQNGVTPYEYQLQTQISNNFDENGECVIEEEVTALNTNLTLKFTKLNKSLFPETSDGE